MNNCYLLLRNNEETGPLSLTELLQLSLTPNDLVWVQGKSAGWRYPFEVDELKEALANDWPSSNTIGNKKEKIVTAILRKEQENAPKKIFVSLPSGIKKQAAALTPSFEEKAEALRQKALSFSHESKEAAEVKYTRSLNDIKEEYSGWIHEQKGKRKRSSLNKPLAFTALVVAIIAAAFLLLEWNPKEEKPVEAIAPATKNITPLTNIQTNSTAAYKDVQYKPQSTVNQLPKQQPSEKIFVKKVAKQSTIKEPLSTVKNTEEPSSIQVPKETVLRQNEAVIRITDLIETTSQYIKNKEGIALSIGLHNKSGKSIRVAAIDVIYFDKAKTQTGKETLYFSNVQPGSTLTKNSSYLKAASASYRIGLVSAESAGLYVMQ